MFFEICLSPPPRYCSCRYAKSIDFRSFSTAAMAMLVPVLVLVLVLVLVGVRIGIFLFWKIPTFFKFSFARTEILRVACDDRYWLITDPPYLNTTYPFHEILRQRRMVPGCRQPVMEGEIGYTGNTRPTTVVNPFLYPKVTMIDLYLHNERYQCLQTN